MTFKGHKADLDKSETKSEGSETKLDDLKNQIFISVIV